MALIGTKYENVSRTVTSDTIVTSSDSILNVDTSSQPITITLQEIPGNNFSTQYKLYINDISGNAATNNITIVAPSGFTVNTQQELILNKDSVFCVLSVTSNTNYLCAFGFDFNTASGLVPQNAVFVDSQLGDDATGEYGNVAKPFKTIFGAQVAAYDYMNANPNLYDMSSTTYKVVPFVEPIETVDTNIVSIEAPRVTIKVAPGVYYATDDFQALLDSDRVPFETKSLAIGWQLNNSFNLMMPYIDYELSAGAILINYGFNCYQTIAETLDGLSPYYYNTEPPDNGMLTRVLGNGTIFNSKTIMPYFNFGQTYAIYLEPNCQIEIECNQHNLTGYFYGGLFKSKTKTYIIPFNNFETGENIVFGSAWGLYFDQEEAMPNTPTSYKHEIISDNIIVDWGTNGNIVADTNINLYGAYSIFSSESFDLVCNNYVGRQIIKNYEEGQYSPIYSRDRDNVATPQWIYNYFNTFSAYEAAPYIYVGNYYDNNEVIVNVDIKYAKFGYAGFYFENNNNPVNNARILANINIPIVDFEYWWKVGAYIEGGFNDAANFFLSAYGDENISISVPNTFITVRSANNPQIDPFYGGGVDDYASILGYPGNYRIYAKIRTRVEESVVFADLVIRGNNMLKSGFLASSISPNIVLDGCVFYSVNNVATDTFFGCEQTPNLITSYDVQIIGNCFTNCTPIYNDIFGIIPVTNTIPGTSLIVSNNIKI